MKTPRTDKIASPLTEWRKLPKKSTLRLVEAVFAQGLEAEIIDLKKALKVERDWVKAINRDNGILLKAADATKAGALCVSQAGRIEHLEAEVKRLKASQTNK